VNRGKKTITSLERCYRALRSKWGQ